MKGKVYQFFLNRLNKISTSILWGCGFILIGLLISILSKPLGKIIEVVVALALIALSLVIGVTAITEIHNGKKSDQKRSGNPYIALITAVVFLILGILFLTTNFMLTVVVAVVGIILILTAILDICMGVEIFKTNRSSYYYLVDGVLSLIGTIIVLAVVSNLMAKGTLTSIPQILLILIGIKLILLGISTFVIGYQAKKGFVANEESANLYAEKNGPVSEGMTADNVEEVEVEVVSEDSTDSEDK